ncbi:phosphotransferase family protein [Nocardioides endophyticus]|uniref:Phosphotransferase family protein n=1 Tax=Nocardioides endophyticus TaxID=1353775 RepID=A0ABP8ZC09_9ACTN
MTRRLTTEAPPDVSLTAPELAGVAAVMSAVGVTPAGPLTSALIAGGRSNLTFRLGDGTREWVLRTPPRTGRTPSAHDVAREFRVTTALGTTDVPVARAVAVCEDEAVLGGPFAVAEYVPGRTLQSGADLTALDESILDAVVRELVGALATLHAVDHVAVGLERFGRPDAYAERQLKRWSGQWSLVSDGSFDDLASVVSERLAELLPEQRSTGIVHGDYRIDNTILDLGASGSPRVAAIVDWELCTIGDPVADVATMLAYRNPAFDWIVGESSAWTSSHLPDPEGLAAAYESAGGVPLVDLDLHLALANYKIAVIAAGIEHRRRAGSGAGAGFDTAGRAVGPYLEASLLAMRS